MDTHTQLTPCVCRLRGSRVLLAGLGGLGAEVAKNLILAGVKGLTLLDHEQVHPHTHTRTHVYNPDMSYFVIYTLLCDTSYLYFLILDVFCYYFFYRQPSLTLFFLDVSPP